MKFSDFKYPMLTLLIGILLLAFSFLIKNLAYILPISSTIIAIGIPCAYLFQHWKTINKWFFLFIVIVSLKIASVVLTRSQLHNYFYINKVLSILITALVLIRIGAIIKRVTGAFKKNKLSNSYNYDFVENLSKSLQAVLFSKRIANIFVPEISTIYYAFFRWNIPPDGSNYTYHKKGNTIIFLYILLFLFTIETTLFHLLLVHLGANKIAKIFTLISIYTMVFLFGQIKAMRLRPVKIQNELLIIKYGLVATIPIEKSEIKHVINIKKNMLDSKRSLRISLFKNIEEQNILLELNNPIDVKMLFKTKKNIQHLCFRVDEPEKLIESFNLVS